MYNIWYLNLILTDLLCSFLDCDNDWCVVVSNRLSDSMREQERLKSQVEERETEIAALTRRLEVRGHVGCEAALIVTV